MNLLLSVLITLLWDANPESDNVQAYYVWQTTNVSVPFAQVTNAATNGITFDRVPGRYFFYVTASNFWGMSAPSNITNTPTVASNVTTLKIQR